MTNREKYAEQILAIACNGDSIGISNKDNTVFACDRSLCDECICSNSNRDCHSIIAEWSNSEYVEKPKISESDRRFLDYLKDDYKYMVRNYDGFLLAYKTKPLKISNYWGISGCDVITPAFDIDFYFIKCEDEEPWLIEDLKNLEVVDGYGKNDN